MSNKPYLSLMGSIVWPTAMTRPDCSYYANYLCQFMSDPTIEAWNAAIALLSYLYNTRSLGLLYERRKMMLNFRYTSTQAMVSRSLCTGA
jgi:hypothetical protein